MYRDKPAWVGTYQLALNKGLILMNNNKNAAIEIIRLLTQEILWVNELITILSQEKEVLVKREFKMLDGLAHQKQALSKKLEESSNSRVNIMQTIESTTQKNVLQQLDEEGSLEEAKEIKQLSIKLADVLVQCRQLNVVNGQVISTNMHASQEIVDILSGKKEKGLDVYTATGDMGSSGKAVHHEEA